MRDTHNDTTDGATFSDAVKPLSAFVAGARLLRNIEDTAQFFRVTDAIDGRRNEENYQRYLRTPIGAKLDAEGVDYVDVLGDKKTLESMPAGSLAQAYLEFLSSQDLSMNMLMDAELEARKASLNVDASRRRFMIAGVILHDIFHVVTRYGRDPVGEACLLTFTGEQFRLPGVRMISAAIGAREQVAHRREPVLAMLSEAREIARKATWVPEIDWREFLPKPVLEARRALNLSEPSLYLQHRKPALEETLEEAMALAA